MNDIADLTLRINSLEAKQATRDLNDLEKQGAKTSKTAGDMEESWKKLAKVLGPAVVVAAIAEAVKSAVHLMESYVRLSEVAGTTAEKMSSFALVARLSGTSMDAIATSVARLGKSLGEAQLGDVQKQGILKALGIDPKESIDAADAFVIVSKALTGFKDQNVAAAVSQTLLSRGFAEMRPLMKEITEQGTLHARATEEQLKQAKELADAWEKLAFRGEQFRLNAGVKLMPVLREITDVLGRLGEKGALVDLIAKGLLLTFQAVAILAANVAFAFDILGKEIARFGGIVIAIGEAIDWKKMLVSPIWGLSDAFKKTESVRASINAEFREDAAERLKELEAYERRILAMGSAAPQGAGGGRSAGPGGRLAGEGGGNSAAEKRIRDQMEFIKNYPKLVEAEKNFGDQYAEAIKITDALAREAHAQGLLSDERLIQQLADNEKARLEVLRISLENQKGLHERKGELGKAEEAQGAIQKVNQQLLSNEIVTAAKIDTVRENSALKFRQDLAQRVADVQMYFTDDRQKVEQGFIERQNIADEALNEGLITQQTWENLMVENHSAYEKAMTDITDEEIKKRFGISQVHRSLDLDAAKTFTNAMSQLMNTKSRELFEIGKVGAIAGAIVDTYKAATGAYAALSSIPIIGPALGAAAAAAITLAGLANVQKIKNTKFGSQDGGGAAATGTFSANPLTGIPNDIPNNGTGQVRQQKLIVIRGLEPNKMFSGQQFRDFIASIREEDRDGMILFDDQTTEAA